MVTVYDSYISDDKTIICFHKSCVDGLFSTIIILEQLDYNKNFSSNFHLIPLTPTEINNRTRIIQQLELKKKIILDLPYFGTNVEIFFDHHITNEKTLPTSGFKGLFNVSAASTCAVLKEYYHLTNNPDLEQLITIANIIDQAKFSTPPPESGSLELNSFDDIVWACNDLIKNVRDNDTLLRLIDTFTKEDISKWLQKYVKEISNYRKRRQETLNLKKNIKRAPIILIINNTYHIQAEGLHFSFATEEKNYKMLILIDKKRKYEKSKNAEFKVTFRLNPNLTEEWTERLRVDKIANILGGGGHKGAASATIYQIIIQYEEIISWVRNLHQYFENGNYFSETKL